MATAEGNKSQTGHVTLDEALKALGRLGTLTYQQRQMAKDGEIKTLLEQSVASIQSSQWFSWTVVAGCGAYALFGMFSGPSHWVCAVISVFLFAQMRHQKRLIEEVTTAVRSYTATLPPVEETDESLLVRELKSRYVMSYQQLQMLKAGQAVEVARECIARLKRNGRMQLVVIGFFCLSVVPASLDAYTPGLAAAPLTWIDLASRFVQAPLMVIHAGFMHWMMRRQIKRLQVLLNEHPPDTAAATTGTEVESDQDSPYRSPQFR